MLFRNIPVAAPFHTVAHHVHVIREDDAHIGPGLKLVENFPQDGLIAHQVLVEVFPPHIAQIRMQGLFGVDVAKILVLLRHGPQLLEEGNHVPALVGIDADLRNTGRRMLL